MFVGGVVGAGESYDEAALREAEEELGVSRTAPRPCRCSSSSTRRGEQTWWSAVYEVRCELPVDPQAEEVAWHAFLPEDELERRLGRVGVGAGRPGGVRSGCGTSGAARGP